MAYSVMTRRRKGKEGTRGGKASSAGTHSSGKRERESK